MFDLLMLALLSIFEGLAPFVRVFCSSGIWPYMGPSHTTDTEHNDLTNLIDKTTMIYGISHKLHVDNK